MANILVTLESVAVDVEHGVEVAAEDALAVLSNAEQKAPAATAALAVLAEAVNTALTDVAATAANPATLVLTLSADVSAVKAVWPDVVTLLATIGIKL